MPWIQHRLYGPSSQMALSRTPYRTNAKPCQVFNPYRLPPLPSSHIITHLPPQQPAELSSPPISILCCGPLLPEGTPDGYDDISLLYLRISLTISKKALSTLVRDFADVSMNLQPNLRARVSPSVKRCLVRNWAEICDCAFRKLVEKRTLLRNLSLAVQIALVSYYDNWEVIFIFDS